MKIELDLPETTIARLRLQSQAVDLTLDEYAAEMFDQHLIGQSESDDDKLANRPDWQAAIARSRDDWNSGSVRSHDEILAWHDSHPD